MALRGGGRLAPRNERASCGVTAKALPLSNTAQAAPRTISMRAAAMPASFIYGAEDSRTQTGDIR